MAKDGHQVLQSCRTEVEPKTAPPSPDHEGYDIEMKAPDGDIYRITREGAAITATRNGQELSSLGHAPLTPFERKRKDYAVEFNSIEGDADEAVYQVTRVNERVTIRRDGETLLSQFQSTMDQYGGLDKAEALTSAIRDHLLIRDGERLASHDDILDDLPSLDLADIVFGDQPYGWMDAHAVTIPDAPVERRSTAPKPPGP